jgi:polyisoprenoid-binding protein YceI
MKRMFVLIAVLAIVNTGLNAQKYFTRTANISFSSDAPMEKIEAHNKKGTSVIDTKSGKMEFAVLIKAFQFEKALMQEHFNENYMESTKYPKAIFKGAFTDLSAISFDKDGTYETAVKGDMTIHGVTKPMETKGKVIVKEGKIQAISSFEIVVADYDIEIPAVVRDNIAKTVKVDIDASFEPFKQ